MVFYMLSFCCSKAAHRHSLPEGQLGFRGLQNHCFHGLSLSSRCWLRKCHAVIERGVVSPYNVSPLLGKGVETPGSL